MGLEGPVLSIKGFLHDLDIKSREAEEISKVFDGTDNCAKKPFKSINYNIKLRSHIPLFILGLKPFGGELPFELFKLIL